jgi:hypothetical protein
MSIPKMADECCFNCWVFWSKLCLAMADKDIMWEKCENYEEDDE